MPLVRTRHASFTNSRAQNRSSITHKHAHHMRARVRMPACTARSPASPEKSGLLTQQIVQQHRDGIRHWGGEQHQRPDEPRQPRAHLQPIPLQHASKGGNGLTRRSSSSMRAWAIDKAMHGCQKVLQKGILW